MKEKKAVSEVTRARYLKARKKERGRILDEFVALTGLCRCYATQVLRGRKKRRKINAGKKQIRRKIYDESVLLALTAIWYIMDCICGKRLSPTLPEIIPILEKHNEIRLDDEVRSKLLKISPASIDRLLFRERKKIEIKGRSHTKPGSMLKSQIPIRTFSEWNEQRPGFMEMDLVGHDGGDGSGDFMQTLDMTDVHTGWTESVAVQNKAQRWVFEALQKIRNQLPFDLLGIDSDNGSEFINHIMLRYCQKEKITFTRTRSGKKNDNCFVEQKNYSVVRRAVGYYRHDTPEELALVNELYQHLRLYTNFFQPVMKLLKKTRKGSKVTKKYDQPKTPYQRLLESDVPKKRKDELRQKYATLNPAELKRKISRIQLELSSVAERKAEAKRRRQQFKQNLKENQSHFI